MSDSSGKSAEYFFKLSYFVLEYITAERVAIFFGLLCTCLVVAFVVVLVHRHNLWLQLTEAREKLDVLEDYIQSNEFSSIAKELWIVSLYLAWSIKKNPDYTAWTDQFMGFLLSAYRSLFSHSNFPFLQIVFSVCLFFVLIVILQQLPISCIYG